MKKFVNLRTPLFIGLSLIFGILFFYGVYLEKVFCAIFSISIFIISIIFYAFFSFKENKRVKGVIFSLIFLFFALFGGISFTITLKNYENANLYNHVCDVSGRVYDITEKKDYRVIILSNVHIGYPENVKTNYKISLTLPSDCELDYGDEITFTTLLKDRDIIFNGRFNVYDVGNRVKYSAILSNDDIEIVSSNKNLFEKVRVFIRDTLKGGLTSEEFSVVYALLTGNSDYMENDTLTNFRASGVAHIFAVSGLHIGFLSTALSFLLSKLRVNKIVKTLLIVSCLFFYSGVCGFSASSLRATIMCAILLLSNLSGERYDGLSSIGTALSILLILFPMQLFFVGFQLSFAVVFSILALGNKTAKLFKFLPNKLDISLATVLVAQIASVPIMIYHFGAFSAISIIVNLLFLPVVSVIFIFSLISVILAGIIGVFELLLPLNYIMKGVIWFIKSVDYTVFMVGGITVGISLIFYYSFFIVYSGLINIKGKIKKVVSIGLVCLFALTFSAESLVEFNRCKVYSFTEKSICATLFSVKDENVLVLPFVSVGADFSNINKTTKGKGVKTINKVFILQGDDNLDAQQVCSILYHDFNVENIFLFGEADNKLISVMNKSFPSVKLNYLSNGNANGKYLTCRFMLNGKGLEVNYGNGKALIFGDFNENDSIKEIKGISAHFAVTKGYEEYLKD